MLIQLEDDNIGYVNSARCDRGNYRQVSRPRSAVITATGVKVQYASTSQERIKYDRSGVRTASKRPIIADIGVVFTTRNGKK